MPHATQTKPLAIQGGPKAFTAQNRQSQPKIGVEEFLSIAKRFGFTEAALERLTKTISNDDLLGNGPNLARFATAFPKDTAGEAFDHFACELMGVKHARGTSSGTGALHAAMVAVGVEAGKEVILPAMGFAATAMAVKIAGGQPVFCDVDTSLQMDPQCMEKCITDRTVAVAPTHGMGHVCDMDSILAIAQKHGLKVVEDCAQSPGGLYKGKYVGTLGDIGCFSISCYKIIGGGEGGMFVSNDDRLFERACQLAEAGGLWRGPKRFHEPDYPGQIFSGSNYRMSELEACIDLVQLQKLNALTARYRHVSQRILSQLKTYQEILPQKSNDQKGDIGYLLQFFSDSQTLSNKISKALTAEGIGCWARQPEAKPDWHLYCQMLPITLTQEHPSHIKGACPVADDLFERALVMGCDQWLTDEDCDAIAAGMNKVFDAYCTPDSQGAIWI